MLGVLTLFLCQLFFHTKPNYVEWWIRICERQHTVYHSVWWILKRPWSTVQRIKIIIHIVWQSSWWKRCYKTSAVRGEIFLRRRTTVILVVAIQSPWKCLLHLWGAFAASIPRLNADTGSWHLSFQQ